MPLESAPLPVNRGRRDLLRKLRALPAVVLVPAVLFPAVARADVITVRSAEVRATEDGYVLNAELDLTINPTLEEALQRGVPLYFVLELEVVRKRWYWLDEKVLSMHTEYRIAWNVLTQQYRVSSGLFAQTLYDLSEVERFLSRVTSRPIARRDQLQPGVHYDAALRLRLDVNQLPKPFQVNALASREWSLQSEWHRFGFTA
jgi:hypothetical protein